MIFVDDFTRMMWIAFLKEKLEALEKFKIFKIKSLRSNRRGQIISRELNIYCEEHGIDEACSP